MRYKGALRKKRSNKRNLSDGKKKHKNDERK
jgi:hypothetical protein